MSEANGVYFYKHIEDSYFFADITRGATGFVFAGSEHNTAYKYGFEDPKWKSAVFQLPIEFTV